MNWRDGVGEFDWFAVDGSGQLGHFATAGFGPAPAAVIARLDEMRDLGQRVLCLPVTGEATGHLSGEIEDWLEMARRGLFAYDWKHWDGPYQRAATPGRPVALGDLPAEVREIVQVVRWPDVNFAQALTVRPEELCPCE
jgi:hypothetical protein